LAYVVAEPEEEEIEEAPEEAPVAEESAAVEPEVEPAAEEVAEEVAVVDEAPVEAEVAAVEDETPADGAAAPEVEAEAETTEVAAIDLAAASRLMRRCTACHQLERERNGVGPHLLGVIGREIGSGPKTQWWPGLKIRQNLPRAPR